MKKIFSGIIALSLLSLIVMPSFVFAQVVTADASLGFDTAGQIGSGALGTNSLEETIISLVNILLGFLGLIAVIIILWGGFKWMTAGGAEEKIGEARSLIISGIVGLAIILGSYGISKFVIDSLQGATGI